MTTPTDSRQVSLGPGIPRVDITPQDLPPTEPATEPATKPEKCWLCLGRGEMLNEEGDPYPCDACDGTGQIGGGR